MRARDGWGGQVASLPKSALAPVVSVHIAVLAERRPAPLADLLGQPEPALHLAEVRPVKIVYSRGQDARLPVEVGLAAIRPVAAAACDVGLHGRRLLVCCSCMGRTGNGCACGHPRPLCLSRLVSCCPVRWVSAPPPPQMPCLPSGFSGLGKSYVSGSLCCCGINIPFLQGRVNRSGKNTSGFCGHAGATNDEAPIRRRGPQWMVRRAGLRRVPEHLRERVGHRVRRRELDVHPGAAPRTVDRLPHERHRQQAVRVARRRERRRRVR